MEQNHMNLELIIASIAILISLLSALWSIWYNLQGNNSNKTNKTTELYILFNQADFHNSRGVGWSLLDEVNESEDPLSFGMLWGDTNDQIKTKKFEHLYIVLSFWQMLYVLGEQNEINKKLANRLFRYEFSWWHSQSLKLIENTLAAKEELPSFIDVFIKKPKWLLATK